MPSPTSETILDDSALDDPSDIDELFSAASSPAPAPEGGPDTPPPPSPAPPAPAEAPPAPAPAQQASGGPAPAELAPPAPPAVATPAPPAPVAQAAPAAVASPAPAAPEPPPVDHAAQLEQQMKELTARYRLSEEDARAMLTEPEVVLPRLAATMHRQMQEAVAQTLAQQIPQMVAHAQARHVVEQEAQNLFFGRWPDLRPHSDAVARVGMMYRAANPKATPAEAVEQIGQIVSMSLGVPMPGVAPVAPAAPAPAPKPSVPPHRPAAAGGTPQVTRPAEPNLYSSFADEDLRSD